MSGNDGDMQAGRCRDFSRHLATCRPSRVCVPGSSRRMSRRGCLPGLIAASTPSMQETGYQKPRPLRHRFYTVNTSNPAALRPLRFFMLVRRRQSANHRARFCGICAPQCCFSLSSVDAPIIGFMVAGVHHAPRLRAERVNIHHNTETRPVIGRNYRPQSRIMRKTSQDYAPR